MDERQLISIITPVYNAGRYMEKTFESVLSQSYSDWEWILVDDCSTDDTCTIIQKLTEEISDPDIRSRIRLIRHDVNKGSANARNTGLKNVRGRYIAYLDADDVWLRDRLLLTLEYMKKENCGFVFTAYEFGDEDAGGTGRIVHVPAKLDYRRALSRTVIFTTTTLFDREKIPDRYLSMPDVASEDTATWWQILRAGYTAYGLDEVTAVYRRPAASLSSNKLTAIKRIWNLYRRVERLSAPASAVYFTGWAVRATLRRL